MVAKLDIFDDEGLFYDDVFNLEIKEQVFIERFDGYVLYGDLIEHKNTTKAWKKVFESWKDRGMLS